MKKYLIGLYFNSGSFNYLVIDANSEEHAETKMYETLPTTAWELQYLMVHGEVIDDGTRKMCFPKL